MRTFECKSLGNNCTWKHTAKTEELMADVVAIHLREVHGMQSLLPELVAKIKNLSTNPDSARVSAGEPLKMKEFRCQDLGMACNWRYIAQTEELIADGVAVHAREAHGIKEFTPELVAKVKNLSHEWAA
jgi:predicted small metal-binding protein